MKYVNCEIRNVNDRLLLQRRRQRRLGRYIIVMVSIEHDLQILTAQVKHTSPLQSRSKLEH